MKKSIKLKNGNILEKLLKYPNELAALVEIALNHSEEDGFTTKKGLIAKRKSIDNLVLWGLIQEVEVGYMLTNKKVVDFTLKRKNIKKEQLEESLMLETYEEQVPKELKEYFRIAKAFWELFRNNLIKINASTEHINKAKFGKWVSSIRLMMDNDNVKKEELVETYDYIKNTMFWWSNVQSTMKLREKFQTIHSQAKLKQNGKTDKRVDAKARTTAATRKDY